MITVPATQDDITPEWLTAALREGGHIGEARVVSFDATVIGEGVGFLGVLRRLIPHYDRAVGGAPKSVIAKVPTSFPEARTIGMRFRYYERENRFYEDVAPHVALRIPRAYYVGTDVEAGNFALLLEDLGEHARIGDQLAGCDLPTARMVVRELAKFHAAWWNHPRLEALDWMPRVNEPIQLYAGELYRESFPGFAARYGNGLSGEVLATLERMGNTWTPVMDEYAKGQAFISHTDFRLDNMLFGNPGSDLELAVIDWQLCVRGGGLYDLGYFVSQSLPVELRRAHERELIRLYHETLAGEGVGDYPFERCWDDYRIAVLVATIIPVNGVVNLDLSNPRAVKLMDALTERATTAVADLNAGELLPG